MDLALQISANDKTVKSDIVQGLKAFNQQSLATQAKKGEQLISLKPTIKITFILFGVDIVELTTENVALKNKLGSYDEKWLEESKNKMLK